MAKRLKGGLIAAAAIGLGLVTLLIAWVGVHEVFGAIADIGWTGFAIFTLYWLLVVSVVGLAWKTAAPGVGVRRSGLFVWGRFLRESAAELLPFAQIGGLVVGARAVIAAGVAEEVVFASLLVDLVAEMAAQAFYTLLGIGLIAVRLNAHLAGPILWPAMGAMALIFTVAISFLFAQQRTVAWLGRFARRWLPDSMTRADAVGVALEEIYRRPGRVAAAVALHLVGWVGGGGASWIALRFMGVEAPFWVVIAIESLMYAVRSVGFALPGALGVQEGAYVLLGPFFGLHADHALALSLLRRARDLVIGVPTLAVWQAREGHALFRRRRARKGAAAEVRGPVVKSGPKSPTMV